MKENQQGNKSAILAFLRRALDGLLQICVTMFFVRKRYSFAVSGNGKHFWEKLAMSAGPVNKMPYSGVWKIPNEFLAKISPDSFELKVNSPKREVFPILFLPGSVKFVGKRVFTNGKTTVRGYFQETNERAWIVPSICLFVFLGSIAQPEVWGWAPSDPFSPLVLAIVNLIFIYFLFSVGGWLALCFFERPHINRLKAFMKQCDSA